MERFKMLWLDVLDDVRIKFRNSLVLEMPPPLQNVWTMI